MKGQRFALHCVGFKHFGEWEGLSELLAALGSCKSGCSSCFADASEQGVSPRIEVGGLTWFALALRSLSRLFLFEARLSGYCVREGESRESTLRSSRLPLAHGPCRAVGFRQDECRPGGLLRVHAFGL